MEIKKITAEDFSSLENQESPGGFDFKVSKHVYNFYRKYPDQKTYYEADYDYDMSQDYMQTYESFGILVDKNVLSRNLSLRNYLLLVEPSEDIAELTRLAKNFVQDNLPEGVKPNYYVINKTMESVQEILYWQKILSDIYPNIAPLTTYRDLKEQETWKTDRVAMMKQLEDVNLPIIFIDDELDIIRKSYEKGNSNTINAIKSAEKALLSKYKPKHIIFSNSSVRSYLPLFSAYLQYQHQMTPHLGSAETDSFLNHLSALLFDEYRMLVEDQLEYIKRLPDLMIRVNEGFEHFVFLLKKEMNCIVQISCVDATNLDTAEITRFRADINNLQVIPLKYEHDMTGDISSAREQHSSLLQKLVALENRLGKLNRPADVTNTFFFERDGVKYLGYVEEIDLTIPALLSPMHDELVSVSLDIKFSDLHSLYPVYVLPGYEPHVKRIISYMKKEAGYIVQSLQVYRHKHAMGLLLYNFNNRGPYLINPTGLDFVTVGLWWQEAYRYRIGLSNSISKHMDFFSFRKTSSFLSVFGGPHPFLSPEFVITEEYLRGE